MHPPHDMRARIERALLAAAYVVDRHGPVYVPIFERLERELAALQANDGAVARARALIARTTIDATPDHSDAGGRKAILSSHPSF